MDVAAYREWFQPRLAPRLVPPIDDIYTEDFDIDPDRGSWGVNTTSAPTKYRQLLIVLSSAGPSGSTGGCPVRVRIRGACPGSRSRHALHIDSRALAATRHGRSRLSDAERTRPSATRSRSRSSRCAAVCVRDGDARARAQSGADRRVPTATPERPRLSRRSERPHANVGLLDSPSSAPNSASGRLNEATIMPITVSSARKWEAAIRKMSTVGTDSVDDLHLLAGVVALVSIALIATAVLV